MLVVSTNIMKKKKTKKKKKKKERMTTMTTMMMKMMKMMTTTKMRSKVVIEIDTALRWLLVWNLRPIVKTRCLILYHVVVVS